MVMTIVFSSNPSPIMKWVWNLNKQIKHKYKTFFKTQDGFEASSSIVLSHPTLIIYKIKLI